MPALTHIARVVTVEGPWVFELYEDDAYYYLGVARHIVAGEGSSATGLVATNGYHPLWMAVLVPLAALFRDGDNLVVAVAFVQAALWAVGVREVARIGRAVGSEAAAGVALVAFAVPVVLTGHTAFAGMESALVVPLLLTIARRALEGRTGPGDDVRLGLLLALLVLARLDTAISAVPLGLWLAARGGGAGADVVRRALRLAAPPAVVLAAYMVASQLLFGTPTPVSGQAKGLGAPFLNTEPLVQFLQAGRVVGHPMWAGAAALVLVAGAVAVVSRPERREDAAGMSLATLAVALVTGEALLLTYLVVATSYPVWPWYHYLLPCILLFAVLVLVRAALDGRLVGERACLLAVGGFLVVQAAVTFRPEEGGYPGSVHASRYVREQLPDDAVLAMGDRAGIFGFLAERPLLHLEGLTADADYLDDMEHGAVADRMAAEGVDYYVHYGAPGQAVTVDGRECQRFHEPEKGGGPKSAIVVCDDDRLFTSGTADDSIAIWAFRPELNGAG